MKSRILTIVLGIALVVSLGTNIYFAKNAADAKGEIAVFSRQIVTADSQISDLQAQLSDVQNQLEEKKSAIAELEERQTNIQGNGNGVDVVIPDDFEYVDREAEEREQQPQQPTQPEQKPQQQPTQPTNPEVPVQPNTGAMPDGPFEFPDHPTGNGDGNGGPYAGVVGTFE